MSKPEDIPQDVWDVASDIFNGKYAVEGGLFSESYVAPMARAILAAKAEEREACANLCGGLRHEDSSSESEEWVAGTFACQAAIRKRGEG